MLGIPRLVSSDVPIGGRAIAEPRAIAGRTLVPPTLSAPSPGPPLERPAMPVQATVQRWSLSNWALLRRGSGAQLAPGGTLGGSQIGARLSYRVDDQLSLIGRAYAPVRDPAGAELALGLEWRPVRSLPVGILVERRQAVGRQGRSAFSLLAHGGVRHARLIGPLALDGYAQAGVVGLRSRDLFADGSARLGAPISGELTLGLGAWGAAQPGAARLDLGPEASYRLPHTPIRISGSYRLRVAGDARPGSGPALTVTSEF